MRAVFLFKKCSVYYAIPARENFRSCSFILGNQRFCAILQPSFISALEFANAAIILWEQKILCCYNYGLPSLCSDMFHFKVRALFSQSFHDFYTTHTAPFSKNKPIILGKTSQDWRNRRSV